MVENESKLNKYEYSCSKKIKLRKKTYVSSLKMSSKLYAFNLMLCQCLWKDQFVMSLSVYIYMYVKLY